MKIEVDLHVHSVASGHAYSTIDEIVRVAKEKRISGIAILDHGPAIPGGAHEYYFSNLVVLPQNYLGVRLYKGAEANIVSEKGELDISDFTLGLLDFVGVSLHPNCGYESQGKVKNTEALLRSLDHPKVRMICHPTIPEYDVCLDAIVEAATEKNILIEINNFSFHEKSFRAASLRDNYRLLELCAEYECLIAVNSDAHWHELVGNVELALQAVKEVRFPEHLIINSSLEKVDAFLHRFMISKGG